MKQENILQGEKVCLTAVKEEDVPIVAEWYQDASFLRLYDSKPAKPWTKEQVVKRMKESEDSPDAVLFAVRLVDSGRIVGLLELDGIAWTHGTTFVSIGIGEEADRRQGYGGQAMRLALRFAFDELNLHRVCLTVFSYNEAAIALYEGLGFQLEGTYREHLLRDGQRHDMLLFGLLRREWKELS